MLARVLCLMLVVVFITTRQADAREYRELSRSDSRAPGRLVVHGYVMSDVAIVTDDQQLVFTGTCLQLSLLGIRLVPYRSSQSESPLVKQAVAEVEIGSSPVIEKQVARKYILPLLQELRAQGRINSESLDAFTKPYASVLDSVRIVGEESFWFWKGKSTPERMQAMPSDWVKPNPGSVLQSHATELTTLLNQGYLVFIGNGVEYRVPPNLRDQFLLEIDQLQAGQRSSLSLYLPENIFRDVQQPTTVDQLRLEE